MKQRAWGNVGVWRMVVMSDSGFDALPRSVEAHQIQIQDIWEESYEAFASCPNDIVTDFVQVQREKQYIYWTVWVRISQQSSCPIQFSIK